MTHLLPPLQLHHASSVAAENFRSHDGKQQRESRCDSFVKVLGVRLAILHVQLARQRHLPPRSGGLRCGLLALRGG